MSTTADHTFCPYKGLQPYTEADRKYFFGRTRDEGIIISNLYASSVTVFYGASGVGKSSVLLAGAVPRLRQEPRDAVVVVFNTWQSEDFLGALKNEVAKQANLSAPLDTALPLDEFLVQTQYAVDLPVLLIFDQFEEYFLYHPPSPPAEAFESAFARVVNRRGTQVNFFLSLREDGLSKLDRFKSRIPTLMNNMLRLEHLDREAAKLAITQPLEEYNRVSGQPPMTIEPSLVRAILNDLQGASAGAEQLGQGVARTSAEGSTAPIETPFLQMVLTRLWDEERAAGSTTLRLQTFEALGRAANIASTHLDTMMARLTEAERDMAATILRYLVTPSGTKIAQEAGALASWTDLTEAQAQSILTRLSGPDMRILRTMQAPGQPMLYEIFHDVLAQAVLNWRRRYVASQAEDRIRREEQESRAKEQEEAERRREKERSRLMRRAVIALSTLLLIVVGVMVFALVQRNRALNAGIAAAAEAKKAEIAAKDLLTAQNNQLQAAVHSKNGYVFLQKGKFEDSAREYGEAIKYDPNNSTLYNSRGYALIRAERYPEAIATLETATAKDDGYVWGHYNLALAYYRSKKEDAATKKAAIKEAEKVLKIDQSFCKTFKGDPNYKFFITTPEYLATCKPPGTPSATPSPTPAATPVGTPSATPLRTPSRRPSGTPSP